MRFVQQTICCSDLDVYVDGASPAFRMLLPEHLSADNVEFPGVVHNLPGRWKADGDCLSGEFVVGKAVEIGVSVRDGQTEALVELTFRNLLKWPLENFQTNICTAMNHLPGSCGYHWANRDFLPPDLPLDRSEQGRYWYARLSPRNYKALAGGEWVPLHPAPEAPQAPEGGVYARVLSPDADASACAAKAPGKNLLFYQAWNVPCRRQGPFMGNACMHLQPFLAAELPPHESVAIRGRVGLFEGDWAGLARKLSSRRPSRPA